MYPVGLGNIRISIDYAHKSPWTLLHNAKHDECKTIEYPKHNASIT